MDFQFWIWLIVVVITLIARARKKNQEQPPAADDVPDPARKPRPTSQPKAISFEDLLREIQGEKAMSKAPEPKPQAPVKEEYEFVDYDDNIPDEIEDQEVVDYEVDQDNKAFETYEAAKRMAYESPVKIAPGPKVSEIARSEHFKGYSLNKRKKPSFNFLTELKDPQGFKKAFIMSEILNKKY